MFSDKNASIWDKKEPFSKWTIKIQHDTKRLCSDFFTGNFRHAFVW